MKRFQDDSDDDKDEDHRIHKKKDMSKEIV